MIQNKEQLHAMASMWMVEAKNDIRRQAMAFMRSLRVSEEELADILGISEGEVEQILRGNGDISLSTFAKMLIATDNMIEIKPVSATPFGRMEQPFPHPSQVHTRTPRNPWCGNREMFQPEPTFERVPPMMEPNPGLAEEPNIDWDNLSRSEIIDELESRGWYDDIDADEMSRTELIDYAMERQIEEEIAQAQERKDPPSAHCNPYTDINDWDIEDNSENIEDVEFEEDLEKTNFDFLTSLIDELGKHPDLVNEIRNIIR